MKIKIAELFAGVGGFRLGFEQASRTAFKVVFSNQWEPGCRKQYASKVYEARYGGQGHANKNISDIESGDIPKHDLLVGGFPCQDFSVAKARNISKGMQGQKGSLWIQIERIIRDKNPKYLFFENVDRLLRSPAEHVGRDFNHILNFLSSRDYIVEWRIINAAEYGYPQKRKRVFIFGYRRGSIIHRSLKSTKRDTLGSIFMNDVFPIEACEYKRFVWDKSNPCAFPNSGIVMPGGAIYATKTSAKYDGQSARLADVLLPLNKVPMEFIVSANDLPRWEKQKSAKDLIKQSKNGYSYRYNEGAVTFPDRLDLPARTILTSEGGASASRTKHIICQQGIYRRLTPTELERLNGFPDEYTAGVLDSRRAFLMGNALVVGIVEDFGRAFYKALQVGKAKSPKLNLPSSSRRRRA